MKYLLFIAFFTSVFCAACNKEHLPEYYFECKVDGKEYKPDNCANCTASKILQDTVLILRGNRGFETLGVGINDNTYIKAATYTLNEIIGRRGDYKFSTTPNDRYFTDASNTGQLVITTLDKTNRIIAGTFFFQAYNAVQNKIVQVTDGKFRLQYTTN